MAAGLLITAALALITSGLYDHNESRLLRLRAREVSAVLESAVLQIQTPLASAAELADATGGRSERFRTFIAPYVGPGRQFRSASLWPLGASAPTVEIGPKPILADLPARASHFFARGEKSPLLSVIGLLQSSPPSLGYEFNVPGVKHGFAVYAENELPKDRRSKYSSNAAFSDLNYVLFLGTSRRASDLLVTSLRRAPITGRTSSVTVPFGDSVFTLVVSPRGPLSGTFFEDLPWIIAIVGAMISLAAAVLTDRLARRRQYAEHLSGVLDHVAEQNHQLYTEQRSISQTLQHALLPDELPELSGLQVGARYVPATSGIDVGGDWYDVVPSEEGRVFFVVGDVSGHGLKAATTMASLRHATLAYAAQENSPAAVLTRLATFVDGDHTYFATVVCAVLGRERPRGDRSERRTPAAITDRRRPGGFYRSRPRPPDRRSGSI